MCIQIFLVFFYIFKESQLISLSYKKQKYEKNKKDLREQEKQLINTLHILKNKALINESALKNGMKKLNLEAIKK